MKAFVDTDVILDLLIDKNESAHAKSLFSHIDVKNIPACTSSVIFTNTFYVMEKLGNREAAWKSLRKMRLLLDIEKTDQKIVDMSLASDFNDFEDAVQYYTALKAKASYFITRNKKDFLESKIPVLTPLEFLAMIN